MVGGKFDRNSVVADPRFKDLAGRDFSIPKNSPAHKIGFKPIDMSGLGLKDDFPSQLARE